jgi:hypothetical protein
VNDRGMADTSLRPMLAWLVQHGERTPQRHIAAHGRPERVPRAEAYASSGVLSSVDPGTLCRKGQANPSPEGDGATRRALARGGPDALRDRPQLGPRGARPSSDRSSVFDSADRSVNVTDRDRWFTLPKNAMHPSAGDHGIVKSTSATTGATSLYLAPCLFVSPPL